jgi:hypothetical protein
VLFFFFFFMNCNCLKSQLCFKSKAIKNLRLYSPIVVEEKFRLKHDYCFYEFYKFENSCGYLQVNDKLKKILLISAGATIFLIYEALQISVFWLDILELSISLVNTQCSALAKEGKPFLTRIPIGKLNTVQSRTNSFRVAVKRFLAKHPNPDYYFYALLAFIHEYSCYRKYGNYLF